MNREEQSVQPFPRIGMCVLWVACVVFLLAEFTYDKHAQPHVHYENQFGFFACAALGTTLVLSLLSSLLRPLLWREREYYDG